MYSSRVLPLNDQGRDVVARDLDAEHPSNGPSIGRRIFRTLSRFITAVLLGVGATLAWQSHGDEAKEMVRTRAPSLAWLLPISSTKSPVAVTNSPDSAPQLEAMARNLAVMRLSLEQLAAKQDQIANNIVTVPAVEQDIREKPSSPPPSKPASVAPRKPPQPAAQSSVTQSSAASPAPPPAQPPMVLR